MRAMRLLLAIATILLSATFAASAAAHDEYLWRHEQVRLTDGQALRVAELERRAAQAGIRRYAPALFAGTLARFGDCRGAEQIMLSVSQPRVAAMALYPAITGPDRACAERVVSAIAADARRPGAGGADPYKLYEAGTLLRRFGREEQSRALVEEAERLFDAEEAALGDDLWSCHGGYCITGRWSARIHNLRLLHGTPHWRSELHRLAALAAPGLPAASDGSASVRVGQRVFDELVAEAARHDEEAIGVRLAAGTLYSDARGYYAARMHALLAEGRAGEAIALLPRAGGAFFGGDPHFVAAHFDAFAASDEFFDRLRFRSDPLPVPLVRALMERGDYDRARTVVLLVQEGAARRASGVRGVGEMAGLAAFLESPEAPVARLARSNIAEGRDAAFGELALFLASRGQWGQFEAAIRQVRDRDVRASFLSDLPCRAAAAGEAAALRAVRRAGSIRDPSDMVSRVGYEGMPFQAYLCLLRRGYGDAAVAYLEALGPARRRFGVASQLPIWSTLPEPARIRRQQADLALALAERHDLWGEPAAEALAVEYERLGDYQQVDRIVERIEDREERARLLVALIESYLPALERDAS
ncbi:MAG TPA: hypothetical protein VF552_13085 [Allosphingosinicella sp.]|jgi:hypothetical protein